MCGIIGYTGKNNAVPYLMAGLRKLEYRGYDSSGIALQKALHSCPWRSCSYWGSITG